MARRLSALAIAFVEEYLKDQDATASFKRAAERVGSKSHCHGQRGYQLLQNPLIKTEINRAVAARSMRVAIHQDQILEEIKAVLMADIGDAFDADGKMLALKDMPKSFRRCISSVEVEEIFAGTGQNAVRIGTLKKLKLWSKEKAWSDGGRHLKMFTDVLEHRDGEGLSDKLAKARERANRKS